MWSPGYQLAVPYVVGGSLASSVYGIPRATEGLVAKLELRHVEPFSAALSGDFYVDADMIVDAIKRRASFNVVHLATMFKADIFVFKGDAWAHEELKRSRAETFELSGASATIRFASPEDTVLHKLVWYKIGNQISDRQWADVLGVLKIQGSLLDQQYLEHWATDLGIADLLERARRDCGDS